MVHRRFRLLHVVLMVLMVLALVARSGLAHAAEAPIANQDHWHGAYGIYICDHYLSSFDGSQDPDKLGIHTHRDGLIHIHPFSKDAEGPKAVLGLLLETTGITLTKERLALPADKGGTDVKTGDLCKGAKGRVRVLSWKSSKDTAPTELPGDPAAIRLRQGQILAFVFAPDAAEIPIPPSTDELDNPCDQQLSDAALAALPDPGPKPKPAFPTGSAPATMKVTDLRKGLFGTVTKGKRVFIEYVVYGYASHKLLGGSDWKRSSAPIGVGCVGRGTLPQFLEIGLAGMKVGGRRTLIVPPSPDISDKATIFLFDLVALA